MINKATIVLGGIKHTVEIINGQRFIDGQLIDDFINTCDPILLKELCNIGIQALRDERRGTKPKELSKNGR